MTPTPRQSQPRRKHQAGYKRSKNGCRNCRVRKVKCDERRPECGPCNRSNRSCEWNPPPPGNKNRNDDENTTRQAVDRHLAGGIDDNNVGAVVRGYRAVGVINGDGIGSSDGGAASRVCHARGGSLQRPEAVSIFTPPNRHDALNHYSYPDERQTQNYESPRPLFSFEINAAPDFQEQQPTYTAPARVTIDGGFEQLPGIHLDTSIPVVPTDSISTWDHPGVVLDGFITQQHLGYSLAAMSLNHESSSNADQVMGLFDGQAPVNSDHVDHVMCWKSTGPRAQVRVDRPIWS
ncbi:hypothetical protein K440DRAFT_636468 [Wilcoxina mikolae CBS 423.85]|nr:hypothetical protein K440DRAFT_636468 [Wilcoxina mikolae CBS 423.85]